MWCRRCGGAAADQILVGGLYEETGLRCESELHGQPCRKEGSEVVEDPDGIGLFRPTVSMRYSSRSDSCNTHSTASSLQSATAGTSSGMASARIQEAVAPFISRACWSASAFPPAAIAQPTSSGSRVRAPGHPKPLALIRRGGDAFERSGGGGPARKKTRGTGILSGDLRDGRAGPRTSRIALRPIERPAERHFDEGDPSPEQQINLYLMDGNPRGSLFFRRSAGTWHKTDYLRTRGERLK